MKMHEIRELIRLVDESKIEEFELENDGTKVLIKKAIAGAKEVSIMPLAPEASPAPAAPTHAPSSVEVPVEEPVKKVEEPVKEEVDSDASLHKIVSPMVGTFYRSPSPDSDPYANSGDRVDEKSVVCIVEAMKLMNEIEAEVRGEIVKVLAENGQLVEYGQPLFLVKVD
ncbi:acetyl-CoA carboxylase biotin carboxyl carrier protein [Marininema halotolerans]|uniref:Biotin carboxyl carrier protein of acetyl-CoA carboxylase n=1 Tax=Marininema halotolerans TaxID=1155944 RepID=A0A1I6TVC1_9BACL|nr:acetyl-CoA carboxylase biotin carboxyl carrier protein [Marininema halotolerans]SFS93189.1 acetyl-CoA carboxylase biotin carboxyl carrier protein [Marininema halotolerans]